MNSKKISIILVLMITLVFAGCHSNSSSKALFPEKNMFKGKIVFASDREVDTRKIYVVNADGTGLKEVRTGTYSNDYPVFSPDGTKIAFAGGLSKNKIGEIIMANIDGSNLKQLTSSDVELSLSSQWSSDGKYIYYSKKEGISKYYSIYQYDFSKNIEKKLLSNVGGYVFSLSPDGRYLAYEHPEKDCDINVKDLVSGLTINLTKGLGKHINFDPAWSPDGKKIAFVSSRDGNNEIYIMDNIGGNIKRITKNEWSDEHPAWSPDSTKLVYTSHRHGDPWGGGELFIMDLNNMTEWQITKAVTKEEGILSYDIHPFWSK